MNPSNVGRRRYQHGTVILKGSRQPTWYLRWLEDVSENGVIRRIHRSTRIGTFEEYPTRKLALRRAHEIVSEAKINDLDYEPRKIMTFEAVAQKWMDTVMVLHKPASQASEKGHVKYHLIPFFGGMQLTDIRTEIVQRFVSTSKLSPKSIRNVMDTFRLIWKTAKSWGYVKHNPLEDVTLPRLERNNRPCYSIEQMRQIIEYAREPYKTLFWILAETGMRGGEVCGLAREDVDLDNRVVTVRQSTFRGTLQAPKTTTAIRCLSISDPLAQHLRHYLAIDYRENENHLLFVNRAGHPLDNSNVAKEQLRPITNRLGFPPAGLHALRHGNATALDHIGAPVAVRTERLGHAKFDMTLRYTHAISADSRAVANQMGRLLCSESTGVFVPSLPKSLPAPSSN